jgi:rhamnose utilization protein RhaD (predicted bifunctional aldolase and dehydrogenase)
MLCSVLTSLREVSARIGRDRLLVQGSGGNTSVKIEDCLWVKASGQWLADALERPVFVGLRLGAVRAALAAGMAESLEPAMLTGQSQPRLRPSIETALHALMPHPVVIHAHGVNSMAIAVLEDGHERAAYALDGAYSWAWINYQRPGAPLANAVSHVFENSMPDVLLLENHGVVVGADTPAAAEARLRDVKRRLELPVRFMPAARAEKLTLHQSAAYEAMLEISGFALDAELAHIATAGPLLPDQVVFLGGAFCACESGEGLEAAARRKAKCGLNPIVMLVPGVGVFAARGRSHSADSVIMAVFEVIRRIPRGAKARTLSRDSAAELLAWDAEKYRLLTAAHTWPAA